MLVLVGCLSASQAGCRHHRHHAKTPLTLPPGSTGMSCRSDAECQRDLSCFISPGPDGFCIPKAYAATDDDEEECLYRATCSAAEALRNVCPACVLYPPLTCSRVTQAIDTPWYKSMQTRQSRFAATCLKPRPEQIAETENLKSKTPQARRRLRPEDRLTVGINGWSVLLPLSWSDDMVHYSQRVHQLATALEHYNFPCPDEWTIDNTTIEMAGQCGRFRNPDPNKPPPEIHLHRRRHS